MWKPASMNPMKHELGTDCNHGVADIWFLPTSKRGTDELWAESKCSPKCFWGPGWECWRKCRKTACRKCPRNAKKKGRGAFFGSFSALFPAPRKHFGEHFFGTFGPELFGGPAGWSAESQEWPTSGLLSWGFASILMARP